MSSSAADVGQTGHVAKTGFRNTLNKVKKEKTWVSPFRQNPSKVNPSTKAAKAKPVAELKPVGNMEEATTDAEFKDEFKSVEAAERIEASAKIEDEAETSIDNKPLVAETPVVEAADVEITEAPKEKKQVIDTIVDLGGGLKLPQSRIDEIARARLAENLDAIDAKAAEQTRLRELKIQKKQELKSLKDQTKVNSTFAKFKRKLDLDKKSFHDTHNQKIQELEASIANIDAQMKDFNNKTLEEIQEAKGKHSEHLSAADDQLVDDKEKTEQDAIANEEENKKNIHDVQISQQRHAIESKVLAAKQSEYETNLELLELQLLQKNRDLAKQKDIKTDHHLAKEELESKIVVLKSTIADNQKLIKESEERAAESTKGLELTENDLLESKASLEQIKLELDTLRAGKSSRVTRLQEAETKRKEYEDQQERLRIEAEKEAEIKAEEERKRKEEEEERKRLEKERLAEEQRQRELEQARIAKEAEDARIAKEAEDQKIVQDEELKRLEQVTKVDVTDEPVAKSAEPSNEGKAAVVAATVPVVAAVSSTPSNKNEEGKPNKKKRFSGLFSFKKKEPVEAEELKDKKSKKAAIAGGLLVGTGAVAAGTAAAIGSTANGVSNVSKNVQIPEAQSKSVDVPSTKTEAPQVPESEVKDTSPLKTTIPEVSEEATPVPESAGDVVNKDVVTPVVVALPTPPQTAEEYPTGSYSEPSAVVIPEDQKFTVSDDFKTEEAGSKDVVTPVSEPTEKYLTGSYTEPSPVVIPEEQKFAISDDFEPEGSANGEEKTSSSESTPEPTATSSKNAKRNAKKRDRKKKKKLEAAAAAAAVAASTAGGAVSVTEIPPASDGAGDVKQEVVAVIPAAEISAESQAKEEVVVVVPSAEASKASPEVDAGKETVPDSSFTTLDPKHPGEKIPKGIISDAEGTMEEPSTPVEEQTTVPTAKSAEPVGAVSEHTHQSKSSFLKKMLKPHSIKSTPISIPVAAGVVGVGGTTGDVAATGKASDVEKPLAKEAQASNFVPGVLTGGPVDIIRSSAIGADSTTNASIATIHSSINMDKSVPTEPENDKDSLYSYREVITYEEFTPEEEAALYSNIKA